jgi:adenine phosphoribosyltransferase
MDLRQVIRTIPDFPQPGVLFRDITPVLEDPAAFQATLGDLKEQLSRLSFNKIAAMESRGFLFAAPLAVDLQKPLVLLRKAGKLPGETASETYALEYGQATLEVHTSSLAPEDRVVILDDLLATGGTARASGNLVRQLGAEVAAYLFVIELGDLGGRKLLEDAPVISLVNYE